MKVLLSTQLIKVESRPDRTYKLTFNTNELGGKEAASLLDLVMAQMNMLLATSVLSAADAPDNPVTDAPSGKTPSRRLRDVLFVYWKQRGETVDFETWYNKYMETFIDLVKDRLEDEHV